MKLFIFLPAHIKINAGSNAMLVKSDKLLNVSFSVHAHTPMAKMPSPRSCKMETNINASISFKLSIILPILIILFHLSYPKNNIKAKYNIFQTTWDFTLIPSSSFGSMAVVMLMITTRCLMGWHFTFWNGGGNGF